MRVRISNLDFTLENTHEGLIELYKRIDGTLKESQLYFSHLLVDGVEVSTHYQEYLEDRCAEIVDVEVLFLTPEQYLSQVRAIVELFMERATPAIRDVAEEFYGKPDDATWQRFTQIMHGIQNLVEIVSSIISDSVFEGQVEEFATIGSRIGEELNNLKDAAEQGDMTLVGDIMNYELLPFIESLHGALVRLMEQHLPEERKIDEQ